MSREAVADKPNNESANRGEHEAEADRVANEAWDGDKGAPKEDHEAVHYLGSRKSAGRQALLRMGDDPKSHPADYDRTKGTHPK